MGRTEFVAELQAAKQLVASSDALRIRAAMPKFFLVVNRTIDSQLLKCTASYLAHSEMEKAFPLTAFSGFEEKYLQITSTTLSFRPSKRPDILLLVSLRINYYILDINGIGSYKHICYKL